MFQKLENYFATDDTSKKFSGVLIYCLIIYGIGYLIGKIVAYIF